MKWVTRARPKVDRVACPWLIKRFVDPAAEFLYVPTDRVMAVAKHEGAIPFDMENVELGHDDRNCSFEPYQEVQSHGSRRCNDLHRSLEASIRRRRI
jgi:hypothetical protein